ncbi:MAG: hypothetical protein HC888_06095 [Candidatus Competibacteraceae bacterium]|nr:hypothetical protein [Candidatus Competibacteraceae bacterium]
MACQKCSRNKKKSQPQAAAKRDPHMPRKSYELRVLQCNGCEASTKFLKNGERQVTIKSMCAQSGRLLINALKDQNYVCPLNKFGKIS